MDKWIAKGIDIANNEAVVLHIGRTYQEAMEIKLFGFEAEKLERRHRERCSELEYGPGLYTTSNRALAAYFAVLNALLFPTQRGAALINIILRPQKFLEIVADYRVLIDFPFIITKGAITEIEEFTRKGVPPPYTVSVFPYESFSELNASAQITVERLTIVPSLLK